MAKVATNPLNLEQVLREMVQDVIFEELMCEYRPGLNVPSEQFFEPEDREAEEAAFAQHQAFGNDVGNPVDPELDMNPIDKELMMNSLLDLEFQHESRKSIPVSVVREMIREHVKKTLKEKS